MRNISPAATLCNYNVINLPWNQLLFNISFSLVFPCETPELVCSDSKYDLILTLVQYGPIQKGNPI